MISLRIDGLVVGHFKPASKIFRYPYPLLFIHGMWGGGWYFLNWLGEAANAGWESWALNLRGHNGSLPSEGLGKFSVEDYTTDVRIVLREIGPAVIIGHSMGGLVAQRVASELELPAAVLVTSAPPRGIFALSKEAMKRIFRYLVPITLGWPFLPRREDLEALIGPAAGADIYRYFVPESGRAALEIALGLIAVDEKKISCPTLVIGTSHDRITPAAMQKKIREKYNSDYFEADSAHLPMLETGNDKVIQKILSWLANKV